MKPVHNT